MTEEIPRPEDQKLFTPREVFHLIDARLTEIDEAIARIPDTVEACLQKRASLRRKAFLKWLHRYIPAGGYASLLGMLIELIL